MTNNNENVYNVVQKNRLYNILREVSDLNVSKTGLERMQDASNILIKSLCEAASASAIYNQRKTIMPQDVDVALENFYNFLSAFDEIFKDDEHFEENIFF